MFLYGLEQDDFNTRVAQILRKEFKKTIPSQRLFA